MGTEASVAPQPEQLGRDILGLERGEADTAHLRTLQQRLQEASRPRLVTAPIAAVIPELGAGEHDLLHALALPRQHRVDHLLHRPAALAAACAGHYAEGAHLAAAFLDLDEGARAARWPPPDGGPPRAAAPGPVRPPARLAR